MTVYLLITGGFFLLFGANALCRPVAAVAVPYSMSADSVDARNFIRAGSGGVTLMFAAAMLAGPFVEWLAFPALVIAILTMGGLLLGRIVSRVVDGRPGTVPRIAFFGELLGIFFGLYWLGEIAAQHGG